jgi:type I restriction enzyme R subunit
MRSGAGRKGEGPPPKKVTVHDMVKEIRERYTITDEEALYIREVTEEKTNDAEIRAIVQSHKDDLIYLQDTYKGQVNKLIQSAYYDRERFSELIDPKYIEAGAIFDIMAYTVIQQNV